MATTKNQKNSKSKKKTDRLNSLEKQEAFNEIVDNADGFLKLKLTLPLGNPNLKKVHTNQFLFTELSDKFPLKNWEKIAKAYNSEYNRYSGYTVNRWYVEGTTVDVDVPSAKAEMKIDLNTFASNNSDYSRGYKELTKASEDAKNKATKNENGKKTSSTKSKTNATSTGDNNAIKNGWWGKWVTDIVKKQVGDETNVLKNCKTMHEFFRWKTRWTRYSDMVYTGGSVYRLEKAWHRHKFNCGDGANYLSAFYSCCGAKTGIYLTYDREHYIVKVVIDGKTYWCDHSGGEGKYNTLRGWNQTWHGYRSGSARGKYV